MPKRQVRTIAHILDAVIQLKDNFSDTLRTVEKNIGGFSRTAKRMGKEIQSVGKEVDKLGSTLTVGLTLPLVAAGTASYNFAADLEDAIGASEQIFKSAAGDIQKWAATLDSAYGIAETEALTYANTMGAMLKNIGGLTEKEAAKQAQTLIELAGDLTAMFGGTTDDAIRALTGALKGNNSMLDNYGMGVNEAVIKSKALEMGLVKEKEELSLAAKQAATLALIMEQTADAQGQAAREANGASGTLRGLGTEIKNLATDIGEVLSPTITPIIQSVRDTVKVFGELDQETKETIVRFAMIAAVVGPSLMVVGKMTTGVGKLIFNFGKFAGTVKKLGLIKAIFSPGVIVVGIILALIAAGILLYKNWDKIKAKVIEVFPNIAQNIATTMEHVRNIFDATSKVLSIALLPVITALSIGWETIKNIFWVGLELIGSVVANIIKVLSGIIDYIVGIFTGDWERAWKGLSDILSGFLGVPLAVGKATINGLIGLINGLIGGLNKIKLPKWIPGIGGKGINIPLIPKLAKGTDFWKGGIVQVHERGGEIIDLPRGSRVFPHDKSVQMAREQGRKEGSKVTNITLSKLADTVVIREEADIDKLANAFVRKLEKAGLNMA